MTVLVPMLEYCNIKTGKLDSNAATYDGEYPFFTCSPETLRIGKYAFDEEAVLLAGNNASGVFPIKYFNGRFNAYQRTYILNSNSPDFLATRYLYYALKLQLENLKNLSTGVATKFLTLGILKTIQIPKPKIGDQIRIVDCMSAYDDMIETNQRRIALLEESARLLYREWFVKLRFPGYELAKWQDGLPERWRFGQLDQALFLQRGFDLPHGARKPGDIPIIASTGVNGFHNEAKANGPGVVTGRSGTLGVVHYVHEDFWPLNTALWVKEFRSVTPFVAYFMLSDLNLAQYNSGASVPSLDRKVVHSIEVLIPPEKIMALFDEQIGPFFEQIRALQEMNKCAQYARDELLPKLMSGTIRV